MLTLEQRFALQEQALLALLDRVSVLDRALAFETRQRMAMEEAILVLCGLPKRVDQLELKSRNNEHGNG